MAVVGPAEYLRRVTRARALYRMMYREAAAVLPPAVGDERVELVCEMSVRVLAEELNVSANTVKRDMRMLVNHKWVEPRKGSERCLGARIGARLRLYADDVAEQLTGVEELVSRRVLTLPVISTPKEPPQTGRGLQRRWRKR